MNTSAYCPECDSRVRLTKKVKMGQQLTCEECRELLEVVGLQPLEFTWALDDESQDVVSYNSYEKPYEYDTEYDMDSSDEFNSHSKW